MPIRDSASMSVGTSEGSHRLPVAERFVSINGEGLHAGRFSAFIRFVGCNLACSYCDTRWACDVSCPSEDMTPEDILRFVEEAGTPCVTLTGGEPCLQPGLPELVELLVRKTGCFIEIETNGSVDLGDLAELRRELEAESAGFSLKPASVSGEAGNGELTNALGCGRIGFTVDCKCPSSGMASRMLTQNYALLGAGDCVKFVVGSREDLEAAKQVIAESKLLELCPALFSPVAGDIEPAEIVSFLQENGLLKARVQVQLHKIIWPKIERGV
ncbi:MAG: radical SAM protein [Coriobacteriia bacterium]|nr:radical SAM protein [Coriobacteriia bacterium]